MLDRVDEALETAIHEDQSLLLIQPADHLKPTATTSAAGKAGDGTVVAAPSEVKDEGSVGGAGGAGGSTVTAGDGGGGSGSKGELVLCCLRFLAVMMRNCTNKHVFSSSEVGFVEAC